MSKKGGVTMNQRECRYSGRGYVTPVFSKSSGLRRGSY